MVYGTLARLQELASTCVVKADRRRSIECTGMESESGCMYDPNEMFTERSHQLYPSDRAHRMPIITPAYPAMCSTHNVTKSTQHIMTQECKRAAAIVDKIVIGTGEWSELFAKHDFFYKYRYYLQIIASTGNSELQLKWYAISSGVKCILYLVPSPGLVQWNLGYASLS